jgi:hypothetical protein
MVGVPVYGQSPKMTKEEKKAMLRDSVDGKFDLSHYIIEAKGFVPVPMIITEPALGGFGGMVIPLFITPKQRPDGQGYTPPDITGGMAMYTANGSWMVGAGRMGSIPSAGLKYKAALGYGDILLAFYRQFLNDKEKKFEFGIKALPVYLALSKRISKNDIYLGIQYLYAHTNVTPKFTGNLPPSITPKDLESHTGALGFFLDWDKRNSIFTADKGARLNLLYSINDNWTGSNYTYSEINGSFNWFVPLRPAWICGLRTEVQHVFNTPPFYAYPSINMRGIPAARYQGATTTLVETEQRFDVTGRWSAVTFGGVGKAIQIEQSFTDATTIYNYGTGFRYLLSRAFKLRAGIDVAKGPDSFGWYIVFGHNWNR